MRVHVDMIRAGDEFSDEEGLIWTAREDARLEEGEIRIPIRWAPRQGGGNDVRCWDPGHVLEVHRPVTPFENVHAFKGAIRRGIENA